MVEKVVLAEVKTRGAGSLTVFDATQDDSRAIGDLISSLLWEMTDVSNARCRGRKSIGMVKWQGF
jgi:hypothetical protein